MTTALLLLMLSSPMSAPRPDLYAARLPVQEQALRPFLGARGGYVPGAIRMVVSGSILTALGGGFGALGIYGLVGAGAASGSTRTVYTALGWTAAGLGMGLAATGIPLLIIGLVQLSVRPGDLGLRVTERGELAVSF